MDYVSDKQTHTQAQKQTQANKQANTCALSFMKKLTSVIMRRAEQAMTSDQSRSQTISCKRLQPSTRSFPFFSRKLHQKSRQQKQAKTTAVKTNPLLYHAVDRCTHMHTHAHTRTHMHTHAHTCTHMHRQWLPDLSLRASQSKCVLSFDTAASNS